MADTLALEKLFDDVAARFTAESTAITQSFGWRERGKQMVQPAHIDWIPGDDLSGDFTNLIQSIRARDVESAVLSFIVNYLE